MAALGPCFGEREGLAEMVGGGFRVLVFKMELAEDCVEEVVAAEAVADCRGFEEGDGGCRAVDAGESDGAVQGDDGRGVPIKELVVEGEDTRPVGGFVAGSEGVAGGDSGLEVVFAEFVSGRGFSEMADAEGDEFAAPKGAILFLKAEKVSSAVGAGGDAGGGERHHGDEGVCVWAVAGGVGGEESGKADGFFAEICSRDGIAV